MHGEHREAISLGNLGGAWETVVALLKVEWLAVQELVPQYLAGDMLPRVQEALPEITAAFGHFCRSENCLGRTFGIWP